eukprot:TRINITY_DN8850_c0_g1_i1.p1 TRINITY_DN8850_c0_g1~~TRINITY_DN8850_c0_g1_i1.p1  ORF type:complete len:863 (+),score=265.32 TRINITY_DN8850_c0_g1_i1:76-2589(+)
MGGAGDDGQLTRTDRAILVPLPATPRSPAETPPASAGSDRPRSAPGEALLSWRGQWEPGWTHFASFFSTAEVDKEKGELVKTVLFRYSQGSGQSELLHCTLAAEAWQFEVTQHWNAADCGWSTVVSLELHSEGEGEKRGFVLLYAPSTEERRGLVALLEVRDGEAHYAAEDAVDTSFSHIVPYKYDGSTFLLCYDRATGVCQLQKLTQDLQLVSLGECMFHAGWSDVCLKPVGVGGLKKRRRKFFCYSSETGESAFESIQFVADGSLDMEAAREPASTSSKRQGCMMVPFDIGSRSCCHFYRPQGKLQWFLEPKGPRLDREKAAETELLHKRVQSVAHPWTFVRAFATALGNRGHVMCYNVHSGALWVCTVRVEDTLPGVQGGERFVVCRHSPRHMDPLPIPHYAGGDVPASPEQRQASPPPGAPPASPPRRLPPTEGRPQRNLLPAVGPPGDRSKRTSVVCDPKDPEYVAELAAILRQLRRTPCHSGGCARALLQIEAQGSPPQVDPMPPQPQAPSRPAWVHICHSSAAIPPPPPSSHAASVETLIKKKLSGHACKLSAEQMERSATKLSRGRRVLRVMTEVSVRESVEQRCGGRRLLGAQEVTTLGTQIVSIPAGCRGVVIDCDESTCMHTVAVSVPGKPALISARILGHNLEPVPLSNLSRRRFRELLALREELERQERADRSLRPRPPKMTQERMESSVRRLYDTNRKLLASRVEERKKVFLAREPKPPPRQTTLGRVAERLYSSPREKHAEVLDKAREKFVQDPPTKRATPAQQAESVQRLYVKPKERLLQRDERLKLKYLDPDLSPKRVRTEQGWRDTVDRLYVVRPGRPV